MREEGRGKGSRAVSFFSLLRRLRQKLSADRKEGRGAGLFSFFLLRRLG